MILILISMDLLENNKNIFSELIQEVYEKQETKSEE
jgi:hypothetical protein